MSKIVALSPGRFLANPALDRTLAYGAAERSILSLEGATAAHRAISAWTGYAPTPLVALGALAKTLGVAEVRYKHEGARFGLKAFKALGGAYAVDRLVAARGGADGLVVTCATDGNHGRAVAWGARRVGAKAVIYIHENVSEGRAAAIASFGAEVRRVPGHYDDAVAEAARAANENGWSLVSDTSWPGYEDTPRDVMQGYTVMPREVEDAGYRPTHVFVQGGVGGLAAAVLSWRWETFGADRPAMIVVEPAAADCLFQSAWQGREATSPGDLDTIMAGLACGVPSTLAWRLLSRGADAFVSVPDDGVPAAMRLMADHAVAAGETGVAGLVGLRAVAASVEARAAVGLGPSSRVLLYGTEGATDPSIYREIVGRSPEDVEGVA